MDNLLRIGDLVIIKKELQEIVGIQDVGIILSETQIIPSDILGLDMEVIDSYNVYFAEIDTMYTIPKGCLEKLMILQE